MVLQTVNDWSLCREYSQLWPLLCTASVLSVQSSLLCLLPGSCCPAQCPCLHPGWCRGCFPSTEVHHHLLRLTCVTNQSDSPQSRTPEEGLTCMPSACSQVGQAGWYFMHWRNQRTGPRQCDLARLSEHTHSETGRRRCLHYECS